MARKERKAMNKLFVDFDGTIAEFKYVGADTYSAPGYSLTLAPHKNVVSAIRHIIKNNLMEVYLVSAVMPFEHCIRDKDEWMDKYLPEIDKKHRIYTPVGKNKAGYISAEKGDIFLDDWNSNLNELFLTTSLEPVKLVNAINDKRGTWKGARVYYGSDFDSIALTIYGISLANRAA